MQGGHDVPWGPWPVSPSLPIEARHQKVVATTNPNQTCSTAPLGTWTLLCGVKINLLAPRDLGVRAGNSPPQAPARTPSSPISSPSL